MKGTLLGEQGTFSTLSHLPFEGFFETANISLTSHAHQLV